MSLKLIEVTGSDLVSKQNNSSWAWWHTPLIPAPEGLRQKSLSELKASLVYMMRPYFRKQTINNELGKHCHSLQQVTGHRQCPESPCGLVHGPAVLPSTTQGACHHPTCMEVPHSSR